MIIQEKEKIESEQDTIQLNQSDTDSNQVNSDSSLNDSNNIESIVDIESMINAQWAFGALKKHRCFAMTGFVYAIKNGVDVIDISKAYQKLILALSAIKKCVGRGGKILFVGTEKHNAELVEKAAYDSGQHYISKRWLGGLLTNWPIFHGHILNIKKIENDIKHNTDELVKKDRNRLLKKQMVFNKYLKGVRDMHHLPSMIVVASSQEVNAIKEASKVDIPIVALLDTSSNPKNITHIVPGNDRSIETVELFLDSIVKACMAGLNDFIDKRTKIDKVGSEKDTKDVAQQKITRQQKPHFVKKTRVDVRRQNYNKSNIINKTEKKDE